jgi:hypothetical protein
MAGYTVPVLPTSQILGRTWVSKTYINLYFCRINIFVRFAPNVPAHLNRVILLINKLERPYMHIIYVFTIVQLHIFGAAA